MSFRVFYFSTNEHEKQIHSADFKRCALNTAGSEWWANVRLVWVCQSFPCAASLAAGQIVTLTFVCFSRQTVKHLNSLAAEARCSAAAPCANFYQRLSSRHNSPPQSSKITTELFLFYFVPSGKVRREGKLPTFGVFFSPHESSKCAGNNSNRAVFVKVDLCHLVPRGTLC